MIYRSNVTCPDLTPHFKHLTVRPMPHSFGHSVPSDWADKADDDPVFGLYKKCGLWTHDEAAILFSVARSLREDEAHGVWLDIGAHTGWTTLHAMKAGLLTVAIDPMLRLQGFHDRFQQNIADGWVNLDSFYWLTSNEFFETNQPFKYAGVCVDGDHSEGKPLEDAINAAKHLAETGVIIFHDGVGRPVREAVEYLQFIGFKTRAYFTPHLVFCCWRGDFAPPDHEPDPEVKRQMLDGRFRDFDFTRCE